MNVRRLFLLLSLSPALAGFSQDVTDVPEVEPINAPPVLTKEQIETVKSQLAALESDISSKRNNFLSEIIERFRKATSSDAAALNFYLDCKKIVDLERKDMTRDAIRTQGERLASQVERMAESGRDQAKDEGDFGKAVRLQLEYLVLTLEAHETPEDEMVKMVPKLRTFITSVLENASKLKGRALNALSGNIANNPFVDAYQIGRYLDVEHWSSNPLNFGEMWEKCIFPLLAKDNRDQLPEQWDARLKTEVAFREESMYKPEYELWIQNELPVLRWNRATYLYQKGPSPINAMGDMLKLIREHPGHASAPEWLAQLRDLVNEASGEGESQVPAETPLIQPTES